MKFVNLTPHHVVLRCPDGSRIRVPTSGTVARIVMREKRMGQIGGMPVIAREPFRVAGLPAPKPGTVYIVSSMTLDYVNDRPDVVAPDTGPSAMRDTSGRIQYVTRLVCGQTKEGESAS